VRAGRVVLAIVVAWMVGVPGAPAAADEPPPWVVVEDGVTQPVFSLANAITETVYVESAVDTDRDGRRDRVAVSIRRPGETANSDIDVPVIFEQSPYRGEFGSAVNHPVDVDELPQERVGGRGAATRVSAARAEADLPGRWTTSTSRSATRWSSAPAWAPTAPRDVRRSAT
jgi:X-Pro dipeptidyl-peptidase